VMRETMWEMLRGVHPRRHCEERSDEAIQAVSADTFLDCFASLAMTSC
jgi:hypothetical protein